MWIAFAFLSALFAGITSIFAKCGIKKTDSGIATAIRTVVVLLFSWVMVFIVGSQASIVTVSSKTILFLILSGLATGASWLCYFKALQLGNINKVVPIDKSSTVLTFLLAAISREYVRSELSTFLRTSFTYRPARERQSMIKSSRATRAVIKKRK